MTEDTAPPASPAPAPPTVAAGAWTRAWNALDTRLRRPTQGAYFAELDGFRAFAIATVFAHHISSHVARSRPQLADGAWLRAYLDACNVGVEVFFAISGYILAVPFMRAALGHGLRVPVGRYLLRRVVRLEPPYLLSIAFLAWLKWGEFKDPWQHIAATATYTHALAYGQGSPFHFVAWSLEIEVQFYLLMPLLAALLGLFRHAGIRRSVLVLLAVAATWRQQRVHGGTFPVGMSLLDYFQFFAAGVLWADLNVEDPARKGARAVAWMDAVAPLLWLAIPWALMAARPHARWFLPLLMLVAFECTVRSRITRAFFAARAVSLVGGMCYTIYLYHWYLMKYLVIWLGGFRLDSYVANLLLYSAVSIPWVLLASGLLYALFERPFMGIRLARAHAR